MKKIILFILLFLFSYTIIFAETKKEFFDNGVLFFKQGHYTLAVDQFSKLIKLAPDNTDAFRNRGVALMKQKKFDLAIQDFEKAKELSPQMKGIHSNLGVAWFYKKKYEKAIKNYDSEIKIAPENHVAYFNRALCFAELKRNKEALDDLAKTIYLKPDFYLAICYEADLLTLQGENAKAIEAYEEVIRQTYAMKNLTELKREIKADAATRHNYATKKLAQLKQRIKDAENMKLPKKKPKIKTALNKRYAIQAGAFLNPDYANKTKNELLKYGFDSRILVLQDGKKRFWYLLRLGDYTDKTDARKSMLTLKKELGIKSVVRPYGSW